MAELDFSAHKPLEQKLRCLSWSNLGAHGIFFRDRRADVAVKRIKKGVFDFDYSGIDFLKFEDFVKRFGERFLYTLQIHETGQRKAAERAIFEFECAISNSAFSLGVLENLMNSVSSYSAMPVNSLLQEGKAIGMLEEILIGEGYVEGSGSVLFRASSCTSNGRTYWDRIKLGLIELAQQKLDGKPVWVEGFIRNAGYLNRYHIEPCRYEDPAFIEQQVAAIIATNPCIELKEERENLRVKSAGIIGQAREAVEIVKNMDMARNILRYNIFRTDFEDSNRQIRARTFRDLSDMFLFLGLSEDASYSEVAKKINNQ